MMVLVVGVLEEAVGHLDVVDGLPDGSGHADGGPVVFAFPLHLASKGGGLLDDGEVGGDGVEAELGVAGSGEAGIHLGVAVGGGEWCFDEVHELDRCDIGGVCDGGTVDRLATEGAEGTFFGSEGSGVFCGWHLGGPP